MDERNKDFTSSMNLETLDFEELKKIYKITKEIKTLGIYYILVIVANYFYLLLNDSKYKTLLLIIISIFSLFAITASISCFIRKSWSRIALQIFSILMLINIPIGTLVGIVGLINVRKGKFLFGDNRIKHTEIVRIYKQRKTEKNKKK